MHMVVVAVLVGLSRRLDALERWRAEQDAVARERESVARQAWEREFAALRTQVARMVGEAEQSGEHPIMPPRR